MENIEEEAPGSSSVSRVGSAALKPVGRGSHSLADAVPNSLAPTPQAPPPPPPPLSTPALPEKKVMSQIITPKNLKAQLKSLKGQREIRRLVDVDRFDAFDKFNKYDYIPLVDSREYLRTMLADINSLKFDGLEQLTDAFLHSLYHCKVSLPLLKWVSLAGCYNITDDGIYWLALAFGSMKMVSLTGCRKVTEKSLFYLREKCQTLRKVDLHVTNCGVLPLNTWSKTSGVEVEVDGCPLISPSQGEVIDAPKERPSEFRKMVIISPKGLPCNPMAVLTGEKNTDPKDGLLYKANWKPFDEYKISDDLTSAKSFNIFQVSEEMGVTDLILSPGCMVILPFSLPVKSESKLCSHLGSMIMSTASKYDDCSYVLLGISGQDDDKDYTSTVTKVWERMQKNAKHLFNQLENTLRKYIYTNWRMAALDFQEQEVLAAGKRLARLANKLFPNTDKDSDKKFQSCDLPMCLTVYGSLRTGHRTPNDLQFIAAVSEADEFFFPWNRQPMKSQEVWHTKDKYATLTPLHDLCMTPEVQTQYKSNAFGKVEKVVSCAAMWGQTLFYPMLSEKPMVSDFQFLSTLLDSLMVRSAPQTCYLRPLGGSFPCWTHADLVNIWPQASTQQMKTFIRLLEKHGCLLKLSLDPWADIKDVSFVYVTYKDLPATQPTHLEKIWPIKSKCHQRERMYFSNPGLPFSFFPNLLRHMMKLGGYVCLWKNGMVAQKGHINVLVEKIHLLDGLPMVLIQVRSPSEQQDLKSLWVMLKLYTSIMDSFVLRYNIGVAKTVPCFKCAQDKDRYELIQSKKISDYIFLEHLVRVGDNRDVRCKTCQSASIAMSQTGPVMKLSDIVPHHIAEGKPSCKGNNFNRCLMCNNCAADGMDCPENLRHGKANWHCMCKNKGSVCNHCGMCQKCFLYLKKVVSSIQPKFEAPKSARYNQDKMQALDEVKVTDKGSIIGFLEKESELTLDTLLSPDCCPLMNISNLKEGFFTLKLSLETPKPLVVVYNSETGGILENGKEVLAPSSRNTCSKGDTLTVTLQYTKTSCLSMLPSCKPVKLSNRNVEQQRYGSLDPNKLFVYGFHASVKEDQVASFFSKFGPVDEVIIKTSDGSYLSYGFVVFKNKEDVDKIVHDICDEKDGNLEFDDYTLSVSRAMHEEKNYTHIEISVKLNGLVVYTTKVMSQVVSVTLKNGIHMGVFLQIETPGKFKPDKVETIKKNTPCSPSLESLPSALEMKMWELLNTMEDICFGGRGMSLTGSACVTLPSSITMETLMYPMFEMFKDIHYHPLCLSWNPMGGKGRIKQKQRYVKSVSQEDKNPGLIFYNNDYKSWNLSRLVHLTNAPGIPASEMNNIDFGSAFFFWTWHFIVASYPEMILPENPNELLGNLFKPDTAVQVKEGLREVIQQGMWWHFSRTSIPDIITVFKGQSHRGEMMKANSKLISHALVVQENVQEKLDKSGLNIITSRFNSNLELFLCPAHGHCLKTKENLVTVPPEVIGEYAQFISFLDLSFNNMTEVPEELFNRLVNLVDFKIMNNFLEEIPASIKNCKKLSSFSASENNLMTLPEEFGELNNLVTLELSANRFNKFPDVILKLKNLRKLIMSHMMFCELPENIGDLHNLRFLFMQGNCFNKLPASFTKLKELEELSLSGVPWVSLGSNTVLTYEAFISFLRNKKIDRWLDARSEDRSELFYLFDENSNGVLEKEEFGKLNAAIFNLFPRFGYKGKELPDESTPPGFPMEIMSCSKLRVLHLHHHGFTAVPKEICQLTNLVDLNVAHNPNLLSLPAELSLLKNLTKLMTSECPLLKTPPPEIRDKGFQSTFAYLQRLMGGAVLIKRTKLMLVGLGGAGKTSLVEALLGEKGTAKLEQGGVITDGIDITTWNITHKGDKVTYNVWDFAGQTVYYNTHQFFLSTNRAIYFLLWNVRLGHEHAGLDFWLSSISVQAPNAPIFVIGSHIDQVSKSELPIEELQQRYPQIVGFHFVSSFTGQGISELKEHLLEVTLQQQYMGEHIPAVWLKFEEQITQAKSKTDIAEYSHIEKLANTSGIFDPTEIFQAVQFLHDLGSLQHFSNEYLKTKVVINPQWIVDVMACVVSVKSEVVKDGRLLHSDIKKVWSDYRANLHTWLLRLTEEFDLTFPLNNEPVNLVPCLMSERRPKIEWPEMEKGSDLKENKMVYKFDYLPAGLFNRVQVRLQHLSDSSLIWKKGSFLKKNVHIALLQQTRDSELIVTVQGPRPENILFLVHEVFEGLIAESFHGVTYDFSMPCPDCQKMMAKDPHMFDASTICRAIDMKAPFLQCIKYFHTISCADLQTMLPPNSHSDFDVHLVQTMQGLKSLRKDLSADIFISYCGADNKLDMSTYITPGRVYQDLENKGYKCWFNDEDENQSTDEMAKALIDASVFLAFVSVNYAQDNQCVNIFKYARLTLKKAIVVVAIGDNFEWRQSKLGILLSDEVFVNMIKPKLAFYNTKFEELLTSLAGKTRTVNDTAPKPAVFFSYTWVNSANAVEQGTREVPGALGEGDPRDLKSFLEENGISCWIDVERVGMNGLFDDIAEGLLSAKVVVVCVSDEYASSPTCQIEFRYAANTLKLPIIMAVVGTGDNWRAMEVGLMSVKFPIVNFQERTKHGKTKLLKLVQSSLESQVTPETAKEEKNKSNTSHKNLSYQELFELAQRKLLRQLSLYAENQSIDVYPRLFVVDFAKDIYDEDADNISAVDEEEAREEEEEEEEDGEEKEDDAPEKDLQKLQKKPQRQPMSKRSSHLPPGFKIQKYCVYTLCEHDEGWHSVAKPIELPDDFGMTDLTVYSPMLARMTAVMKYSKKMVLNCLTADFGEDYLKWLEESPDASMSDYQTVYHMFREMVMNADTGMKMGNLMRCHLTNGKTIWLCDKHRESMRVTCLSNKDTVSVHLKDKDSKINNWMLSGLRSMEKEAYADKFVTVSIAKRSRHKSKPKDQEENVTKEKKQPKKTRKPTTNTDGKEKDASKPSALKKSKDKTGTRRVGFSMQDEEINDQDEDITRDAPEDESREKSPKLKEEEVEREEKVSLSRQSSAGSTGSVVSGNSSQLQARRVSSRRKPLGSTPIHGTKGAEKASRACVVS